MMKNSNLNPVSRQGVFRSTPAQTEQAFSALECCEGAWCCKTQYIGIHIYEKLLQTSVLGGKVILASWRKRTTPQQRYHVAYRCGIVTE